MGIEFVKGMDKRPKMVADRQLMADTALTTLMEAGDRRAGFQVASRAGKVIPPEMVAKLDLVVGPGGRVMQRSQLAAKAKKAVAKAEAEAKVESGEAPVDAAVKERKPGNDKKRRTPAKTKQAK